ncbi:hypothetical protein CHH92_07895 [Bacillus sonorensis]|nr:hypothetical protein [Bacillus sonorensis]PAD60835.1 hypothetical protein CHH92_07895 [Bacillus sonorensis]RHJ11815.1 hypothetical protein DW143_05810 [Bacillus sonorensis]
MYYFFSDSLYPALLHIKNSHLSLYMNHVEEYMKSGVLLETIAPLFQSNNSLKTSDCYLNIYL